MKKVLCVVFVLFIVVVSSSELNAQLNRHTWLFGGALGYSTNNQTNSLGTQKYSSLRINGTAGYFIQDKLVVELVPGINRDGAKLNASAEVATTVVSFGPAIRYYLLPAAKDANFFLEAGYAYGTNSRSSNPTTHSHSYSISGGPEFFLNSSVGLALTVGYTHTKQTDQENSQSSIFQVGIGFLFHLEKDR